MPLFERPLLIASRPPPPPQPHRLNRPPLTSAADPLESERREISIQHAARCHNKPPLMRSNCAPSRKSSFSIHSFCSSQVGLLELELQPHSLSAASNEPAIVSVGEDSICRRSWRMSPGGGRPTAKCCGQAEWPRQQVHFAGADNCRCT